MKLKEMKFLKKSLFTSSKRVVVQGNIDGFDGRFVWGWAISEIDPTKNIDLEVLITDTTVGFTTTGLTRADIAKLIHPKSAAGFRFDFANIGESAALKLIKTLDNQKYRYLNLKDLLQVRVQGVTECINTSNLIAKQKIEIENVRKILYDRIIEIDTMRGYFDRDYYIRTYASSDLSIDPFEHFMRFGWREGRNPTREFSCLEYLQMYPDVAQKKLNPFAHYLLFGKSEGRKPAKNATASLDNILSIGVNIHDYVSVSEAMDLDYYKNTFLSREVPKEDLFAHYLLHGWREGRNPTKWFSTAGYLRANPDVDEAGINPFVHYLDRGQNEGRDPLGDARQYALSVEAEPPSIRNKIYREHNKFAVIGAASETLDPTIIDLSMPRAKLLAFYIPHDYPGEEYDLRYGAGFAEWGNVTCGLPRFEGHYQPRLPKDLGFYDLRSKEILREQSALAKTAGVYGFCFFYYSSSGRPNESSANNFRNSSEIDMPFTLMWADLDWTKSWKGGEKDIVNGQRYEEADETTLLQDLARHFADPRFIQIQGRPLFFIFRPDIIPDSAKTISRWRRRWKNEFLVDPLIFTVQGTSDIDPRVHGLDGAIEYPPHKFASKLPAIDEQLSILDQDFSGRVMSYEDLVARSLDEPAPEFPLIKTAAPSWDEEARRPGRGTVLHGGSPARYERWLSRLVQFTEQKPIFGERFVAVNAWNNWTAAAYLEPDVHYGAAYLNATARALTGLTKVSGRRKLILVGPDASLQGAQILLRDLARLFVHQFGLDLHIIVLDRGPLLDEYRKLCSVTVIVPGDVSGLHRTIDALAAMDFLHVIVNTAASGWVLPVLKSHGTRIVALVHEPASLIHHGKLEEKVRAIAANADAVVFPAEGMAKAFQEISGPSEARIFVKIHGVKTIGVSKSTTLSDSIGAELKIPFGSKLIVNGGFGDSRQGFDKYLKLAQKMIKLRDDVYFLWVGANLETAEHLHPLHESSGSVEGRFFVTKHVTDVSRFLEAADLFLATSREDSFPPLVLEALAAGLPVVGCEGRGSSDDLIRRFGAVVDHDDLDGAVTAIERFLDQNPLEAEAMARERRREMVANFQFDSYGFFIANLAWPGLSRVSVAVPNYNYMLYIEDRLRSVFRQTYPIFETIVLDDCSTDNSIAVIQKTLSQSGREAEIVINQQNSGSVFRQWRKAVDLARGEYIWIAEADDVADEAFLECLADTMSRSGAALAFSDSWQIGSADEHLGDSYRSHLNEIEAGAFDESFVMEGEEFLRRYLSVRNIILNVSAVLWRRDALLAALNAVGDELYDFKVAGDWRVYIEICRAGGKVAWEASARNGHRRHASSVTHALASQRHYDEILAMQALAARSVDLSVAQRKASAGYRKAVRRYLGLAEIAELDAD